MQLPKDKKYTYADYLTWDDEHRYEIIDGVPYMMAPAPSMEHQSISMELSVLLGTYLKGKACKVFAAPFDVKLDEYTVVQPDLTVVCDKTKLSKAGCKGAPDMIVEILSPTTSGYDKITKRQKYLVAGVREYWVVYPDMRSIEKYLLRDGIYESYVYTGEAVAPVSVLEGCTIPLVDVFPQTEQEPSAETPPWE